MLDMLRGQGNDVIDLITGKLADSILGLAERAGDALRPLVPCASGAYLGPQMTLLATGMLEKWVSADIGPMLQPLRYAAYSACPTYYPSADQAVGAFLAGAITDQTLRTWVQQNNFCWPPYERIAWSARTKTSIDVGNILHWQGLIGRERLDRIYRQSGWLDQAEAVEDQTARRPIPDAQDWLAAYRKGDVSDQDFRRGMGSRGWDSTVNVDLLQIAARTIEPLDVALTLKRRELIDDAELDKTLAGLGYLYQGQRRRLAELEHVVPPATDLTRFMVRDVDDQEVIERYGMDADFEAKFAGRTRQWARWQGIDEDYMRRVWRAHWQIPSPGQLYHMLHRLERRPAGDPLRVELADVETALKQQDVLPYWIPKLLAVSYRPLTRVDVRRAFDIGELSERDVTDAYLDQGYSRENADRLTRFAVRLRNSGIRRHWIARRYAAGSIDQPTARQELVAEGYPAEPVDSALRRIDEDEDAAVRARCVAALRIRFMRFEFGPDGARQRLIGLGVPAGRIDRILRAWACEREARGIEATASQLCRWLSLGLITAPEMQARLMRAGWHADDATRIVLECGVTIQAKMRRQLEAEARKEQAEQSKAVREAERAAKEAERNRKELDRARERARKLKEQRERALVRAAKVLADARGIEFEVAFVSLKRERDRLARDYAFSPDERIDVLVMAAERAAKEKDRHYSDLVTIVAAARDALEPVVPPPVD